MRKYAILCLLLMVLTGCGKQPVPTTSAAESASSSSGQAHENIQSEALQQAAQAGLIDDEVLDEDEALARLGESIDLEQYHVVKSDTELSIGSDDERHDYYVFDVSNKDGSAVGQVAIDRVSGEKYNYLGEGTIDDYATFPLYDPSQDDVCDWEGKYASSALQLTILQGDNNSFEYTFSDGTTGHAAIRGNTAKSIDGNINFLWSAEIVTVAGGTVTGNYKAA